jgi:hypothetical protein
MSMVNDPSSIDIASPKVKPRENPGFLFFAFSRTSWDHFKVLWTSAAQAVYFSNVVARYMTKARLAVSLTGPSFFQTIQTIT